MRSTKLVWSIAAQLGEGALWSSEDGAIWFVDIEGRAIHRLIVASGLTKSWPTPGKPGFIVRTADQQLIVGIEKQLAAFDPHKGTFKTLLDIENDLPENRINDGTVGPDGALWFGTLHMPNSRPEGSWYRWDGREVPRRIGKRYVVTNGPAFSPDGATLYISDSVNQKILKSAVGENGNISRTEIFAQFVPGSGYPDGLAVDADGCIWVAMFAGYSLRRYDPAGDLMEVIGLPCAHVTKPAFGGPDKRTMFVTTARTGLSARELEEQPDAGALFAIEVDTPGIAVPTFHLASPY